MLKEKRPKYFILENVPGLLNHDKGRTFTTILNALSELGYGLEWQVLNSADFFVPQSRKRVYLVGYRDQRCAGKILPFTECNPKTVMQIIGGSQGQRVYNPGGLSITLAANSGGQGGKTGLYDFTWLDLADRDFACIDLNPDPKITELVRCLKSRYNSGIGKHKGESSGILESVMACLTPGKLNKRQNGPRFRAEGMPMFTITATDRQGILEGVRIRKLTPHECLRLQGFTSEQADRIVSVNSDNQVYKQAGNAVTVNVVNAIGQRIKEVDDELCKRRNVLYGL